MAPAGVDAAVMKPAALVLNLAVAAIATVRFARARHFSWPPLWPFAVIFVPFASGLAGNVSSLGALPSHVWLWSGIVVVGELIGSELGSRRVAVATFRRCSQRCSSLRA